MPKQTTEAFFPRPPKQVWRVVTDPSYWKWPGGPAWIFRNGNKNELEIIVRDDDGLKTTFFITAYAPERWFAVRLANERTAGVCDVLFFPERGGTRVEFTADVEGRTAAQKLLLRLFLGQWQQYYIKHLKWKLGLR